ncbi:hypothetical protein [Streptomyces sp. NPDC050287]
MVNTLTHDPPDRVRSYQLLAEGFELSGMRPQPSVVAAVAG